MKKDIYHYAATHPKQESNTKRVMRMKILFCTIIGILFCAASGNCQQRGRVVVCEFEVSRNLNLDQLGEKKKSPIDYCKLAELDKYNQMLELPYYKTDKKKPCIKITDFVKSKKNRSAIAHIVARKAQNNAKNRVCSTRLVTLQASAIAAYKQKFYGKYKPESIRVSTPTVVQPTNL
jgi:hypothetical protein